MEITSDVLQTRYGYRFFRRENTAEDIYFETEWRDAAAFDDERASGVDFVRTRIYIEARPRNRSAGIAGSFSTTFRAEVESRLNMTGQWTQRELTPEREEYLQEIATFIENQLRIAFR